MTTTILSQCQLTDREWVPEREGLATTLARIGATMPEIDRQSFVRVMNIGDNHLNAGTMAHHKMHWNGASRCPAINGQKKASPLTFRIMGRKEFIQHPEWRRCQYCSEQLASHGSGL